MSLPPDGRHPPRPSRRSLLTASLAAGVSASLARPRAASAQPATPPPATSPPSSPRVLRFAHPTDIHVQPELRGGEGMAAALRHMMALPDRPQLILNGGDCPMDAASTPHDRAKVCWDLFFKTLRDELPKGLPVHSVVGNHDLFGRDKQKSQATGQESYYGRQWYKDLFQIPSTFYSFDTAGWHFVLLDSITLLANGDDYVPRISGPQLDWLKADLAANSLPTVVVSHVPIVSVANFFDGSNFVVKADDPYYELEASRMHADCRELESLFRLSGKVKLCLAGHLHLTSSSTYNGITYATDGAVSSNKWKGIRAQSPHGYGLIDLHADGTFRHQYVPYAWTT